MMRVTPGSLGFALLAMIVAAALAGLGVWQVQRAHDKEALLRSFGRAGQAEARMVSSIADIRALTNDGPVHRPARISGRYLSKRQLLLDNQVEDGRVGFEVLTPLEIDGGLVIVNRGWVPMGSSRRQLPEVSVATGTREVVGVLTHFPQAGVKLSAASGEGWPRVVQYPGPDELADMLDAPVAPLVLRLGPEQPAGYRRDWEPAVMPPMRHYGYAVQWFALAITVVTIYGVLTWRRRRADIDERSEHD